MDNWISVKERLPENEDDVLVYFEDGDITIAFYDGDWTKDGFSKIMREVTHWQPLPQSPKGECE